MEFGKQKRKRYRTLFENSKDKHNVKYKQTGLKGDAS